MGVGDDDGDSLGEVDAHFDPEAGEGLGGLEDDEFVTGGL